VFRCEQGGGLKAQAVLAVLDSLTEGKAFIATDVGRHQMWAARNDPVQAPAHQGRFNA
jgi:acetolactate synthase-1/2/3 large subunit